MASPAASSDALLLDALPILDLVVAHVCRRQHCAPDEHEDFGGLVRLRLLEDDCAVLRRFGGRSSLRTYLAVVVQRLFLDYRRSRWGVWRPSAEARRLGAQAVRLDVLVHRDGVGLDEAIERMRYNEGVRTSEAELRALAERLPAHRPRRIEGEHALAGLQVSAGVAVEQPALSHERETRAAGLLRSLQGALASLPPEDALIVRLRFFEGFEIKRVAEWLALPPKPLYRRIERLLLGLRAALEAQGFAAGEVGDLLGGQAFDAELAHDEEQAGEGGSKPAASRACTNPQERLR